MICEIHSWEIIPGKTWEEDVEVAKRSFKFEKETYGHEVFFLRARTGKRNRVIVMGFFESIAARDEYAKKLFSKS